jgi:uncharacterized protein (TIGR02996 family)
VSAEAAFLRDIVARPDDTALRLIFADWLEENGQPKRAELQRLWCRLAKLPANHRDRAALEKREQQLRRAQVKALCSSPVGTEILGVLDKAAEVHHFPMLDNGYIYAVDVRLSAYGDRSRWAIVVESMGVFTRDPSFGDSLDCYGNCLLPLRSERDFVTREAYRVWRANHPSEENLYLYPLGDGPSASLLASENGIDVNPQAKDLRIRDRVIPLPRDPERYRSRGVTLEEPSRLRLHELMRCLAPDYRAQLVATEEELHWVVPAGLPRLLRLDEWRHPNLADDQLPSRVETFRMVAAVLAGGDPAYYRPPRRPNTHWSNWPMGGTL